MPSVASQALYGGGRGVVSVTCSLQKKHSCELDCYSNIHTHMHTVHKSDAREGLDGTEEYFWFKIDFLFERNGFIWQKCVQSIKGDSKDL